MIESHVAAELGKFSGPVRATWLDDGRTMELLEDFEYADPHGVRWLAPCGSRVDGASIPRLFWSVIGGPFEGHYRAGSVLHDVACQVKMATWPAVHEMFYHAMRAGGSSIYQAKIMYYAVYRFGPRWMAPGGGRPARALGAPRPIATEADVQEAIRFVCSHDPSLAEIRGRSNS